MNIWWDEHLNFVSNWWIFWRPFWIKLTLEPIFITDIVLISQELPDRTSSSSLEVSLLFEVIKLVQFIYILPHSALAWSLRLILTRLGDVKLYRIELLLNLGVPLQKHQSLMRNSPRSTAGSALFILVFLKIWRSSFLESILKALHVLLKRL